MGTKGPEDGWAYSKIELNAIWAIEVPTTAIVSGYEQAFQFHRHAGALPNNPQQDRDRWAANVIARAAISEYNPGIGPEDLEAMVEAVTAPSLISSGRDYGCDVEGWLHFETEEDFERWLDENWK